MHSCTLTEHETKRLLDKATILHTISLGTAEIHLLDVDGEDVTLIVNEDVAISFLISTEKHSNSEVLPRGGNMHEHYRWWSTSTSSRTPRSGPKEVKELEPEDLPDALLY